MNQQQRQHQSGAGKVKVKVEGKPSHLRMINVRKSKKAPVMYSSSNLPNMVNPILKKRSLKHAVRAHSKSARVAEKERRRSKTKKAFPFPQTQEVPAMPPAQGPINRISSDMNTSRNKRSSNMSENDKGLHKPFAEAKRDISAKFTVHPATSSPGEFNWRAHVANPSHEDVLTMKLIPVAKNHNVAYVAKTNDSKSLYERIKDLTGRRRFITSSLFEDGFKFIKNEKVEQAAIDAKLHGRTINLVNNAFVEQLNIAMEFVTQFIRSSGFRYSSRRELSFNVTAKSSKYLPYNIGIRHGNEAIFDKVVFVDFINICNAVAETLQPHTNYTYAQKVEVGTHFLSKLCAQFKDTLFISISNNEDRYSSVTAYAVDNLTSYPNWLQFNVSTLTKFSPDARGAMHKIFGFSEADDFILLALYTMFYDTLYDEDEDPHDQRVKLCVLSFDRYRFYTENYRYIKYFNPLAPHNMYSTQGPYRDLISRLLIQGSYP